MGIARKTDKKREKCVKRWNILFNCCTYVCVCVFFSVSKQKIHLNANNMFAATYLYSGGLWAIAMLALILLDSFFGRKVEIEFTNEEKWKTNKYPNWIWLQITNRNGSHIIQDYKHGFFCWLLSREFLGTPWWFLSFWRTITRLYCNTHKIGNSSNGFNEIHSHIFISLPWQTQVAFMHGFSHEQIN